MLLNRSAVASMAEEVHNPSRQVPLAIAYSIPISFVIGVIFLVPILFTLPDIGVLLAGKLAWDCCGGTPADSYDSEWRTAHRSSV
jgi:amino acid transporter